MLASGYLPGEEGGIGIHCDPGIEHKFGVGRWDWMDGFMPNNEREERVARRKSQVVGPGALPYPH